MVPFRLSMGLQQQAFRERYPGHLQRGQGFSCNTLVEPWRLTTETQLFFARKEKGGGLDSGTLHSVITELYGCLSMQ